MANQYTNKVVLKDGTMLIDLTSDSVQAADVAQGKTFHLPSGEPSVGTASGGGGIDISDYLDTDITGMNVVYQAQNITLDGASIVNTGVKLFSSANISKDFKIIITELYGDNTNSTSTENKNVRGILSAKNEINPYPGFVCRLNGTSQNSNGRIELINKTKYAGLVIERKNGSISVSVFGSNTKTFSSGVQTGALNYIGKQDGLTTVHDTPLTLGGECRNDGVTGYRFASGSIGTIVVALGN